MTLTRSTTSSRPETQQGARVVRIPPPLYFAVAFAGGMTLRASRTPLHFGVGIVTVAAGGTVLAGGVGLAVAGVAQVRRARTTIVPHRAASTLLTTGAYRLSRNPMYTGLAIAHVGGTVLAGSWWPLFGWPLALLAIRVLVIGPEERYLTTRFGRVYLNYRSRTHRWIGPARSPDLHPSAERDTTSASPAA